jgi:ribosomal protein S18 acetylase RimI-like enzyme
VRPDLRGGEFEREILELAYDRTVALMGQHDIAGEWVYADAFRDDAARAGLLTELGWEPHGDLPYVLNRREIGAITVPPLPGGFSFRSARGVEDAAALADVHNGAFKVNWTPALYRQVMESPGYDPERELLIEAPDGTFVAFTITWHDPLNRTGLFEPVGVHRDYQRRGFGRAILMQGMANMAAAGMWVATVATFGTNEAACGLYEACGFEPWYLQDDYKKHI